MNQGDLIGSTETRSDQPAQSRFQRLYAPVPRLSRMSPRVLLATVWLLSALYLAYDLKRGWLPHDDGVLAQSAERVLFGDVPHRDFDEIYTGALSYLNAASFRLFGTNLASMRYVLYAFFIAWVPSLYFIARQFATPIFAAGFTFLAVLWSVPNYPTAMPSWYNLFFATFGVASLFRFIESRARTWLFVAGLCGGVSFLFKLSGLYYVAGAALFLLGRRTEKSAATKLEHWICFALSTVGVLIYLLSLLSLLSKAFYPGSFLYFFLPVLAVGATVIWQQFRNQTDGSDLLALIGALVWFAAGVVLPIALFLVPYIRNGAVHDFVRGVFILPGKRLHFTIRTESLPRFIVGTVADLGCLALIFAASRWLRIVGGSALIAGMVIVAGIARTHPKVYDAAWVSIWNMLPVVVVAGLFLLLTKANQISAERQQKILLVLAVTACCSVIQFPYSAPIYFCYVAPLLVLSILAISSVLKRPPLPLSLALFCAFVGYTILDVTPTFLNNRGGTRTSASTTGPDGFVVPRSGGLRLYGSEARENSELVKVVQQHAQGRYIFAATDCPQVYFLSGFRNPTRLLFDFIDEPQGRTPRTLAAIHSHDVNLVVLNRASGFSGPIPQDLKDALTREFPEQAETENFEIRWKQ